MTSILFAFPLFIITAIAEIFGCYALYLWLVQHRSFWWAIPAAISLGLFGWLLTLHPSESAGRIYAAYGGVYIASSLVWLMLVEKKMPDRWTTLGVLVCLVGAAIIMFGQRGR
jgi:small multidrug resistance family-3 protein